VFGINAWEMIAIAVIALLIFGPDKLPGLAQDAARLLREIRKMASGAQAELRDSLGPELGDLNLSDLDPRSFVKRNLFDPIDDEVQDLKRTVDGGNDGNDGNDGGSERKPRRRTFDSDTT
jgi:sec-independent protein translocase protein TatB